LYLGYADPFSSSSPSSYSTDKKLDAALSDVSPPSALESCVSAASHLLSLLLSDLSASLHSGDGSDGARWQMCDE
jgi:hypothetical protein